MLEVLLMIELHFNLLVILLPPLQQLLLLMPLAYCNYTITIATIQGWVSLLNTFKLSTKIDQYQVVSKHLPSNDTCNWSFLHPELENMIIYIDLLTANQYKRSSINKYLSFDKYN